MDKIKLYDIAIIGLGPAGATLARLLDDRFSIIGIDQKHPSLNTGFQKPCGGLIAPDAQALLFRSGLTLPASILADPQIFGVKTLDFSTRILRHYPRTYLNVNRHAFDQWLISLIGSKVHLLTQTTCQQIQKVTTGTDSYYQINLTSNGQKQSLYAKKLIAADGAKSIVRHTFFANHKIPTYLSIQKWFVDEHPEPVYACFFDPDITRTCAWSLSKNGYFIVGGAFDMFDAKDRFEALTRQLKQQGFYFSEPIKTEACQLLHPTKWSHCCLGNDSIFLIGEAAGFISPSSYEGISYALDSAYRLSRVLNKKAKKPGKAYRKAVLTIRLKLITKMIKAKILYHPFLRKLIMKSGIGQGDVIPD